MAGSARRSRFRSLFVIVFMLALFGLLGMLFAQRISPATTPSTDSDVRDSLKQFTEVYETIEQNYADPVNPDKAIYNGAIPSMLHQLDPHSNFFDPKSYSALREEQRGKYYGVGMTVGPAIIRLSSSLPSSELRPIAPVSAPATSSPPSTASPPTT